MSVEFKRKMSRVFRPHQVMVLAAALPNRRDSRLLVPWRTSHTTRLPMAATSSSAAHVIAARTSAQLLSLHWHLWGHAPAA